MADKKVIIVFKPDGKNLSDLLSQLIKNRK